MTPLYANRHGYVFRLDQDKWPLSHQNSKSIFDDNLITFICRGNYKGIIQRFSIKNPALKQQVRSNKELSSFLCEDYCVMPDSIMIIVVETALCHVPLFGNSSAGQRWSRNVQPNQPSNPQVAELLSFSRMNHLLHGPQQLKAPKILIVNALPSHFHQLQFIKHVPLSQQTCSHRFSLKTIC